MTDSQKPSPLWQSLLVWIILIAGFGISYYVVDSKEAAEKKPRPNKTPIVMVEPLALSEKTVSLQTRGVVEESQVTDLAFQVAGKVSSVSPAFEPGNFVKKGEVLAELVVVDFETALANAQVQLAQARLNLLQAEQNKLSADEEWKLYSKEDQDKPSPLLLKEPQFQLAQKSFLAAKAMVELAGVNLERAVLRAPYDGVIAKRNIFVGSVVQGLTIAGVVLNSEECWVRGFLPLDSLSFMKKNGKVEGAPVQVTVKSANKIVFQKQGEVQKVLPRLEGQTRLAQLMIKVKNPYETNQENNVFLFSDLSVEISIEAASFKDVVVIKREYLRENDEIWLYASDKLKVQAVEVIFRNQEEVVLVAGDWLKLPLIISDLPILKDGMSLNLSGNKEKHGK